MRIYQLKQGLYLASTGKESVWFDKGQEFTLLSYSAACGGWHVTPLFMDGVLYFVSVSRLDKYFEQVR